MSHRLLRDGRTAYDAAGRWCGMMSRYFVGHAKCACGALSPKGISIAAAWQWFREHNDGVRS